RPEGRREVLAGIVDLGRFEQLHKKADDQRREMESELKTLAHQLSVLPVVEPLELEAAKNRITEAEERRTLARAEVERWQGWEFKAGEWQALQQRLAQARSRYDRAQNVLADAAGIEQAVARLRELREILPKLHEIVRNRGEHHSAGENLTALGRDR